MGDRALKYSTQSVVNWLTLARDFHLGPNCLSVGDPSWAYSMLGELALGELIYGTRVQHAVLLFHFQSLFIHIHYSKWGTVACCQPLLLLSADIKSRCHCQAFPIPSVCLEQKHYPNTTLAWVLVSWPLLASWLVVFRLAVAGKPKSGLGKWQFPLQTSMKHITCSYLLF